MKDERWKPKCLGHLRLEEQYKCRTSNDPYPAEKITQANIISTFKLVKIKNKVSQINLLFSTRLKESSTNNTKWF